MPGEWADERLLPNYSFNTAMNQINTPGFAYDADGNLTSDGSHTYQYDAEGHIISADNGSTATLAYNALGQEMEAKYNGTQLEFVYDPMGHQVGTYSVSDGRWWDGNVMFGDRALTWTWGNGMQHESAVRTTTMTTLYDGAVAMDELYNPWGSVWAYVGSYYGGNFNGMSGEPEGLNFYHADHRMYTSALSRWMTPDPLGGNVADPQSLNRYAYALNNPTTLTDPSGLDPYNSCSDPNYFASHASCAGPPPCEFGGPCPPAGTCFIGQINCGGPCDGCGGWGSVSVFDGGGGGGGTLAQSLPPANTPLAGQRMPAFGFSSVGTLEQTAPIWLQVLVEACASNPYCMLAAGVDPEVVAGVAGIGVAALAVAKLVPHIHYAHRKGKRKSTWDKHTKPRPGRDTTKDRQKPGWKPRTPPRPQDIVPKSP